MQQLVGRSFPFRFASGPETHFAQHRELEEALCAGKQACLEQVRVAVIRPAQPRLRLGDRTRVC